MDEDARNALIEAIWRAMDATSGDESEIRDVIEQALSVWEP